MKKKQFIIRSNNVNNEVECKEEFQYLTGFAKSSDSSSCSGSPLLS
jgi:hypothetical protein